MNTPTPKAVLKSVEAINEMDKAAGGAADILKPEEVFTPKPKAPRTTNIYVTNTGFRDSEPLRKLQSELHREANKRKKR